jgi:hypothetical protein
MNTGSRRIAGGSRRHHERLLNALRRYGIRFCSRRRGERYEDWDVEPSFFEGAPESDRMNAR